MQSRKSIIRYQSIDAMISQASPLLRLPVELRFMIWDLLFESDHSFLECVSRQDAYYRKYPKTTSRGPANYLVESSGETSLSKAFYRDARFKSLSLKRTCRQVYISLLLCETSLMASRFTEIRSSGSGRRTPCSLPRLAR